jgi:hypothetical protein
MTCNCLLEVPAGQAWAILTVTRADSQVEIWSQRGGSDMSDNVADGGMIDISGLRMDEPNKIEESGLDMALRRIRQEGSGCYEFQSCI